MSIQIERIMKKHPQIFYDVSYEDSDGIWIFMNPSWYCAWSETGCIHEWTIKDVMYCARNIFQDKQRFIEENPNDHKAHKRILSGEFDSNNPRFLKNTKKYEKDDELKKAMSEM